MLVPSLDIKPLWHFHPVVFSSPGICWDFRGVSLTREEQAAERRKTPLLPTCVWAEAAPGPWEVLWGRAVFMALPFHYMLGKCTWFTCLQKSAKTATELLDK